MSNPALRFPLRPLPLITIGVILLLATVLTAEVARVVMETAALGPFWQVAIWSFGTLTLIGGSWLIARECGGYLRVRRVEAMRARLSCVDRPDPGLRAMVEQWFDRLGGQHDDLDEAIHRARQTLPRNGSVEALRACLDSDLMPVLDRIVETEIRREAIRVGVLTSLTPLPLADALIALWRSTRLIRRIAQLHGARPGAVGTWHLLRETATAALAADLSQHAADALSSRIGVIAASAGQGVLTAALVARVGLWTQFVCRPVAQPRKALGGFVARGAATEIGAGVRSGFRRLRAMWRAWRAASTVPVT
jgi:putative membrane protein